MIFYFCIPYDINDALWVKMPIKSSKVKVHVSDNVVWTTLAMIAVAPI